MDRLYTNLGLFPVTSGRDEVSDSDAAFLRDSIARLAISAEARGSERKILDNFVDGLIKGVSTPQQFKDAIDIAHKFAGSLGMFGYPLGSQVARDLEQLLETNNSPDPRSVRESVESIRQTLGIERSDS